MAGKLRLGGDDADAYGKWQDPVHHLGQREEKKLRDYGSIRTVFGK